MTSRNCWRYALLLTGLLVAGTFACETPQDVPDGDVGSVGLAGAPVGGGVLVGQSLTLVASTYDHTGNLITGQAITWVSSDTTVLRIQNIGTPNSVRVLGLAVGHARVTAIAGGRQAYVEIAVREVPVSSVEVGPTAAATYPTLALPLTAIVRDSLGRVREDLTVVWRSSNSSVATVSTSGEVRGVAAGSVTITATAGGVSATSTITVLPRPIADWSAVVDDWTVFQGNASHTGYVSATLDPVIFAHEWTTVLTAGAALTPATTGDGGVYVSTNTYFGTQRLHVLDAANGQLRWTRDFGSIHSVDPPAYGGGTVYVQTGGHQDSYLWGLGAEDNTIRFRTSYGNQWSRWYAPVISGGRVYMAGGYYGGMYAMDATSGTEQWFLPLNQYDEWTPAVRDGRVYAFTGSNDPKVSVTDVASGALLYEIPDPNFSWSGWSMDLAPVLGQNDLLAAHNGRLISFDLGGRTIRWTVQSSGWPGYTGQVSVGDGVVYAFSTNQVEARRQSDGASLWLWVPPSGALRNTMVVTRNLLFVTTDEATYAIDLASHRQVWSYPASGHLALGKDGRLLIARGDGAVTSIRVK